MIPITSGVMNYQAPRNPISATPPSRFNPNIFLGTLFSNTLSVCCSLKMTDQITHSFKTTSLCG